MVSFILLVLGFGGYFIFRNQKPSGGQLKTGKFELKKFQSEDEFKKYISDSQTLGQSSTGVFFDARSSVSFSEKASVAPAGLGSGPISDRASSTNVQVSGVDEADVVKTDGQEIYFSGNEPYYLYDRPLSSDLKIMPPVTQTGQTKLIKALPVENIAIDGKIEESGELLLTDNMLTVFSSQKVSAYDVTDKKNPQRKWELSYQNNNYKLQARLYNKKIYLITQEQINQSNPCPIVPFKNSSGDVRVACTDIYHPTDPFSASSIYHVSIISPQTGVLEKTTSFVGSSGLTTVYMSQENIYLAYSLPADEFKMLSGFIRENKGFFPESINQKVSKLDSYDLSPSSKMYELQNHLSQYMNSWPQKEREARKKEFELKATEYGLRHRREFSSTGLVKIETKNLNMVANGVVPGTLLNQFSLDEYNGNLRVATTIGQNWMWGSNDLNVSDIYVLNAKLAQIGSLKDLGEKERIYSARFIGDKGYLVTFRQTDPFYVIDLVNPKSPQLKGELKIPGYSSYLHPIDENRILGIGKEGSKVKVSLFNVKDAANPKEISKLELEEYWSEALNNHRAFLMDAKHEAFFIPGSQSGLVIGYKGNNLKNLKTVGEINAKRAVYINDALYIIATNKIVVLNEKTWEVEKEISL